MATKKKKSDYTPRPTLDVEVHPEVLKRLEVVSRVMSGQTKVTDAAKELGLSRNRFQTIYHRSLGAMMDELEPKPGGRPPKDPRLAHLESENQEMEDLIRQLMQQLEASRRATAGLAEIVREHRLDRESPRPAFEADVDEGGDSER